MVKGCFSDLMFHQSEGEAALCLVVLVEGVSRVRQGIRDVSCLFPDSGDV